MYEYQSLGHQVELLQQQRFLPLHLLVLILVVGLLLPHLPIALGEVFCQDGDLLLKATLHLFHLFHQSLLVTAAGD